MNRRSGFYRDRLLSLETLEDRRLLAVSAIEQYVVYRINYARDNPVRFQTEQSLPVNLGSVTPKQPLAVIDSLFNSAEAKVNDLVAKNYFAHVSPTGVNANLLLRNNGYALPATLPLGGLSYLFPDSGNSVESIAAGYPTPDEAVNGLIVDAGVNPPGHRNHLLSITDPNTVYNEIGVGHLFGNATTFKNYWAIHATTRNIATRYVTGVVYNDVNSNGRYDLNEGLSGVTVDIVATGARAVTNAGGGYAIAVPEGDYEVRAQGGGYNGVSIVGVRISGRSEEVDFRSGRAFGQVSFDAWSNTAPTLNTAGSPTLPPINVSAVPLPNGTTVSSLISGALSDPDPAARRGIAITGTTNSTGGKWQYFTGGSWTDLPAVSATSSILLRESDQVRFVSPTSSGSATLRYRGWDQSTGTAGGTANVSLGAGGTTAFSSAEESASITVLAADLSLVLTVSTISENGGSTIGTVSRNTSTAAALTVNLTSSNTGAATVPASVTIPVGSASTTFTVNAVNDSVADGSQTTTISATATGLTTGTAALTVTDDEIATLALSVLNSSIRENGGTTTATVTRNTPTTSALIVNLSSSDVSEATVPATVTIPANAASATFTVTAVNDTIVDGNQNSTISASAVNLVTGTTAISILDDDTPTLSLSFANTFISEVNGTTTATLTLSSALSTATLVQLTNGDTSALSIPANVTILAGQTTATFTVTAIDNLQLNLPKVVQIQASSIGLTSVSRTIEIQDDDSLGLWQNSSNAFDVDENGLVLALDVLIIINNLRTPGIRLLPIVRVGDPWGQYSLDVNRDGYATPLDALLIINFLNRRAIPRNAALDTSISSIAPSAELSSSVDQSLSDLNWIDSTFPDSRRKRSIV